MEPGVSCVPGECRATELQGRGQFRESNQWCHTPQLTQWMCKHRCRISPEAEAETMLTWECPVQFPMNTCSLTVPSSPHGLLPCTGAGSRSLELPKMTGAAIPTPAFHLRPPSNAGSGWGGALQGGFNRDCVIHHSELGIMPPGPWVRNVRDDDDDDDS